MIYEVTMPALSSTMTEGKITAWQKKVGDKVEKGETIVVIESDKADMDAESFYDGYLGLITVKEGETVPVGTVIAYIAETEAEIAEIEQRVKQPAPATQPEVIPQVVVSRPAPPKSHRIIASPRAKKLAQANGIDLAQIQGTGPNGRITASDVENLLKPAPVAVATKPAPASDSVTVQPLTGLQQAVVRNMNASLAVPTFQVGYTITTTALDELYKQIKSKGVTMTALLAKAVAIALTKHPLLNSAYTDQGIVHKPDINIAVAVAMDDGGLITPVLRNADQIDIYSLSRQWKTLVEKARSKQLTPDEYSTGTFTISNLGMYGVDRFTAILPPNTGAILAIGAVRPTVVATPEGAIAVKNQMQVNLTADHRVIYGAHAAEFLRDLAQLIETNATSLTL
ncbi:MAG: dihydrolipoamide acetyltransferase family protein [Pseudanabaenaceae cyanobacterium]